MTFYRVSFSSICPLSSTLAKKVDRYQKNIQVLSLNRTLRTTDESKIVKCVL
jgi:hypothetical protein